MPRWWVYLFWATIIFSILYFFNVPGFGVGKGRIADYDRDIAAAASADAKRKAAQPAGASGEQLTAMTKDASVVALGKQVFGQNCAACHRADAGGQIGPNLADDYWLHGGTLEQIHKTVVDGVLEKGMPPWGKVLKPNQVDAVVAYVYTLRGTNPPNPKAPQGDLVPR
jgi:cytochrome c oxidase cbb3-type subunit 3